MRRPNITMRTCILLIILACISPTIAAIFAGVILVRYAYWYGRDDGYSDRTRGL